MTLNNDRARIEKRGQKFLVFLGDVEDNCVFFLNFVLDWVELNWFQWKFLGAVWWLFCKMVGILNENNFFLINS